MSKKSATYKSLDQRTHVLHRPDMYIGTVKSVATDFYVASKNGEVGSETTHIYRKSGTINPGLHRIEWHPHRRLTKPHKDPPQYLLYWRHSFLSCLKIRA